MPKLSKISFEDQVFAGVRSNGLVLLIQRLSLCGEETLRGPRLHCYLTEIEVADKLRLQLR